MQHAHTRRNRTYLLSPSTAVQYTAEFLLFVLFFSVDYVGFALALGLYSGLIYARRNMLVITPMFVLAGCVFLTSWWTLIFLVVPAILFLCLFVFYYKIKRNVPMWASVATAFASLLPSALFTAIYSSQIVASVATVVVGVIFSFCCQTGCYAILIRGLKCRFTLDEKISFGVFGVVFAYATYLVRYYDYSLFYLVLPFIVLSCTSSKSTGLCSIVALVLGIGTAVASGDLATFGCIAIIVFSAFATSIYNRFWSMIAMVCAEVFLWLLGFDLGWQSAVLSFGGGVIYCVLPLYVRERFFVVSDKASTLCSLVNRDRNEVAKRLNAVSNVFADMAGSLSTQDQQSNPYTASRLSKEIARSYCGKCADRDNCFKALGGDTSPVIEPLADAALSRGKATILDMPTFITSRCVKTHNLASVVNNSADEYRSKIACLDDIKNSKKMMAEQFAGMALVLDSLADDCGKNLRFGSDVEDKLEAELLKHNVVANETVICGEGIGARVALTVRECDAEKLVLTKVVSRCMRGRFAVESISKRGEERTVHLVSAPIYEVAYGIADSMRDGQEVSGDGRAVLAPSLSKRIFALADGMGSGGNANQLSANSIKMIENFYRAGFEDGLILSLVNKLLLLECDDNFSAIDVAVVDTLSGGLDVIKLGAADSFILRKTSIEVVKSSQPPVGILQKIEPITARYQLYDGDMFVLCTDGVTDALGESGIIEVVNNLVTYNPQTLADGILESARQKNATDDCTVLVARLTLA